MQNPIWHLGALLSAVALLTATRAPAPGPVLPVAAGIAARPGGPPDTLVANPRATSIHWKGTAAAGRTAQEGSVALRSGMFVIRHEMLTSGSFSIDMRSLAMQGTGILHPAASRVVRGRLSGPAYFDGDRYPAATFVSSGMQRIGPSRWRVSGNLTMHGVTRPLSFDADVQWVGLGHLVATTTFPLDRRAWGVGDSGASMVDDVLTVTVRLDAQRKTARVAAGQARSG